MLGGYEVALSLLGWLDSHTHLGDAQFDVDRALVRARAVEAHVSKIIEIGLDVESSRRAVALSEGPLWAAVGIHPQECGSCTAGDFHEIARLALHPRVVAIGEIGLDFYRDQSSRQVQFDALRRQLEVAVRVNKPVSLHVREAFDEVLAVLDEYETLRGVFHCFTGDEAMAREALARGFYLSFAGMLTFKKNAALREVASAVPLDRVLIETDAPYLAPVPHRGRRNEPAYVVETGRQLAALHGLDEDQMQRALHRNFDRLFQVEQGGEERHGA